MSIVSDSNEPKPPGDLARPEDPREPAAAAREARTAVTDVPWVQAPLYAVGAALIAGLLAWGIGEKTYDYFRPSAKAQQSASARDFSALNREKQIADQYNTAIVFGTFGALLGLFSGAAGGALGRSFPGGASAALACLLLGGVAAALVSYELVPVFAGWYKDESPSLLLSFLVRGGIWAVVGMTAGLAFGWGWRGFPGIAGPLLGGLAGSVIGTIAFEAVNAIVFPGDRNDAVIPSSMQARLLAYLLVSVGAAIGAVLLGRHRPVAARGTSQAAPR